MYASRWLSVVCLVVGPMSLILGQGCPSATTDTTDGEDLTAQEKQAIVAAGDGAQLIASAANMSQTATGDLDSQSGAPSLTQAETFGTCPEVTKEGSVLDMILGEADAVCLTIDFGETPCPVISVEDEGETLSLDCSGSATGSFSLTGQSIYLAFDSISCSKEAIDGVATLTYNFLAQGVELAGDWDLTYLSEDDFLGTEGNGVITYEPVIGDCCDVASINAFDGTVTDGNNEWSLQIDNIQISFEQYGSFIPYSGSITIDGPGIRAITIIFTEASPTSGEITVRFSSGREITTDLEDLEEYLDTVPAE